MMQSSTKGGKRRKKDSICCFAKMLWIIFIPVTRAQKPRSRHPGQPVLSYEHINIFTDVSVVMRNLGNRPRTVKELFKKEVSEGIVVRIDLFWILKYKKGRRIEDWYDWKRSCRNARLPESAIEQVQIGDNRIQIRQLYEGCGKYRLFVL